MSSGARMEWNGPVVEKKINTKIKKRITAACIFLRNKLRIESSRKQPTRGTGLRKRGLYPSAKEPPEPPKRVSGRHIRSIVWEVQQVGKIPVGRVGSNYKVSKWLQIGTLKMKPRPWLSLGYNKYRRQLAKIIESGVLPKGQKDPLSREQRRKVKSL